MLVIIVAVCAVISIIWAISRKSTEPDSPTEPLNPICYRCGESACVFQYKKEIPAGALEPIRGNACYIICSACGEINGSGWNIGKSDATGLAVSQHNRRLQEKNQLKELLWEAAQQGVDPENFNEWLKSKGLK
jgi:hypothetical protein